MPFTKKRERYIDSGKIIDDGDSYKLVDDIFFRSPSTASNMVLGRNSNGRTEWKDSKGRKLNEIYN